ncbi:MAG: hypothetical protein ACI94Y_002454 [Maribacter sp.]|jgi:hypothetical protein
MKYLNTTLLLLFSISLMAQTSFTNSNAALGMGGYHSGVAIAVTDVNGDGLDDIAHLQQGRDLYVEYQQTDGSFMQVDGGTMAGSSEWSMVVGDVDNNGISDVLSGGAYSGVTQALANASGSSFTLSDLPNGNLFVQGSNLADIDNDGWLDYFACHDDAESRIWGNDGTGNLISQDAWIDMSTPGSDNSGNYGSVWCDFDYDGDLDLYIAKCRQGVNDDTDPRRINVLYENDGNGNYTENADAYGLRIGAQSWTADFADIDNDGDFDCFITNHDVPSQLLRNDDGYFNDITATSGINISVTPIQGIMEDFDNDGFVDVLIAGGDEQFFHNNGGDGTFTEMDLFDNEDMESFAIGDLNHDGFLDIYGGYASIYTNPSNVDDVVWLNNGNTNNYFAVNLQGVISNKSAVGAKVELHGPWGIQIREVRAGEGYGIVNSLTQHFGIGQSTTIDQVIVKWPSGIIDVIDNPTPNQFLTIVENNCTPPVATITSSSDLVLCTGSSLDLTAPNGYNYEWSNGETSQTVTITEGGSYGLTITDGTGCPGYTSIDVTSDPVEVPTVAVTGALSFCEGESVMLTSSEASAYTWSNGMTSQSIEVTAGGTYEVTTQGTCDEFTSESVAVDVLAAPAPMAEDAATIGDESVILTATGNDLSWYDAETGGNLLETGASYITPVLTADATYYVEDRYQYGGGDFDAGIANHAGNPYSGSQYNGSLIFDVTTQLTLTSVKVYTDFPGERIIELRDASGTVLESMTFDIQNTEEVLVLNFNIMPGTDYELGTNGVNNNTLFEDNSPELKRTNEDVNYPYTVLDVLSITGSDIGAQYYYYYYDWKIELPEESCISTRTEVFVDHDSDVSTNDINKSDVISIYPNPTSGYINLEMSFTQSSDVNVTIMDIAGKQVRNIALGTVSGETIRGLDLLGLAKGIYTIKVNTNNEVYAGKIVLQ